MKQERKGKILFKAATSQNMEGDYEFEFSMRKFTPPYEIKPEIINRIASICEIVGSLSERVGAKTVSPRLRRTNTIRTVQASCAIEGNELSLEQVTALFEGSAVVGSPREVQEVRNALKVYGQIGQWHHTSEADLLSAHQMLMIGLLDAPGKYRKGGAAIRKDDQIVHMAPPAANISRLMGDLFSWLKRADEHPLIMSTVFHYEFEFIHPFSDGNGRLGRFWQTLILRKWSPLFAYVPVETLIRENQADYYRALNESGSCGSSTPFILFMLNVIKDALNSMVLTDQVSDQVSDQVKEVILVLGHSSLTVAELLAASGLKHRPTFRRNRLNPALEEGFIEMVQPDSPRSPTQRYRLTGKGLRLLKDIA